jgi:hypothetical protein
MAASLPLTNRTGPQMLFKLCKIIQISLGLPEISIHDNRGRFYIFESQRDLLKCVQRPVLFSPTPPHVFTLVLIDSSEQ